MSFPNFSFERRLWKKGHKLIAGVDEVGRGSFSGPVVVGCVVFPVNISVPRGVVINDSKKLNAKKREIAASWIKENALTFATGSVSAKVVDEAGLAKATNSAFRRAIINAQKRIDKRINFLLIDAFYIPYTRNFPANGKMAKQRAITKGDEKSLTIAASSIIAKTYRDSLMISLSERPQYKKYNWGKNKGYGTKEHRLAIKKYGLTGYHRKTFVGS